MPTNSDSAAQDHVCGPDCQCGCEAGRTIPVRSAAYTGWQVGAPGYPVLGVDYNESDEDGLLYATVAPWKVKIGDRVLVRDADGLACWAYVRGPWLDGDGPELVGVEVDALSSSHEWDELNPEAT